MYNIYNIFTDIAYNIGLAVCTDSVHRRGSSVYLPTGQWHTINML